MRNLDGSPPVTPMFIAVIDGKASTNRGHLVVDTADAWDGLGYQLVRVPVTTQGVRLTDTAEMPRSTGPRWWEQEDAR